MHLQLAVNAPAAHRQCTCSSPSMHLQLTVNATRASPVVDVLCALGCVGSSIKRVQQHCRKSHLQQQHKHARLGALSVAQQYAAQNPWP
eukprot:13412049-Alexandrium_andersonii.AAC.1